MGEATSITWTNDDWYQQHHMVSLGYNELNALNAVRAVSGNGGYKIFEANACIILTH